MFQPAFPPYPWYCRAYGGSSVGTCIIEKYLTLSRLVPSPDGVFSLEPHEFKKMLNAIRITEKAIGKVSYKITKKGKSKSCVQKNTADRKKGSAMKLIEWEVKEDSYQEQIIIPEAQRALAAEEGISAENKQKVAALIQNLNTGETYTARLAITGTN